jgi:hypothetical protein
MSTPDTKKVRRKMLLSMLTGPATAVPFLAGLTALVATWAFGLRGDVGVLAGVAGVFGASGAFFTKLFLGGEKYAKQALDETLQEERLDRERALDQLDASLCQDHDPRTEAALRDLRSLMRAFEERRTDSGADLTAMTTIGIAAGVQELFDQCVQSLERSLKLWQTAEKLRTRAAREPILKQREEIVLEVGRSIHQLGQTLVAIQKLGSGEDAKSELTRIGEELDQRLVVAKQVEQRVRAFESQLESGELSE